MKSYYLAVKKYILCLFFLVNYLSNGQKALTTACQYEESMKKQGLVNIHDFDTTILVDLKYSTTDNFVGKDMYGCIDECFMQKKPAQMLATANKILMKKNSKMRLLIYDGGRPNSIQKILWASLPQYIPSIRERYVSDPAKGSIHNYGSAVDLTIAENGKPLDMGTKYDFFGELAYPKYEAKFLKEKKLTIQQVKNRQLLRDVMRQAGFMPIEYEWWHFNALSKDKAKRTYAMIK